MGSHIFLQGEQQYGRESLKLNELEIKRLIKRCVCVCFRFPCFGKIEFFEKIKLQIHFPRKRKKKEWNNTGCLLINFQESQVIS